MDCRKKKILSGEIISTSILFLAVLLAEVFIVVILSSTLAAAMTVVTWRYGPSIIESFVLT